MIYATVKPPPLEDSWNKGHLGQHGMHRMNFPVQINLPLTKDLSQWTNDVSGVIEKFYCNTQQWNHSIKAHSWCYPVSQWLGAGVIRGAIQFPSG